jgi:hypothetical protein
MTKRDGNLRRIFRDHLKTAQWSSIETGATAGGVPDSEYCFYTANGGGQGWIEFKAVKGWRVTLQPAQVSWISRRVRLGGVAWIAAVKDDVLYMVHGLYVHDLHNDGLRGAPWARLFHGGPRGWDWQQVECMLRGDDQA